MNLKYSEIPCMIIRGGTSKAVFVSEDALPSNSSLRDKIILGMFGSPDPRQIDGLGGADPLTSKLAIIGPPSHEDADVDYTFGQVDIHKAFVDYSSNCGNISSAVGLYAIKKGLVKTEEPITKIRIHNTNTKKIFVAEVPVSNGKAEVTGNYKIDGVPNAGAKILLDFSGTVGSKTGKLLPTGNEKDVIAVDGFGELTVSMVDAGSPMVFIRAEDIGLTGIETPAEIDGNPEILNLLERIRSIAAVQMGLAKDWRIATETIKAVPMVAFVAKAQPYTSYLTGEKIECVDIDFVARDMFMQVMHKTYSGTATVCTGSAAVIPGTVVNDVVSKKRTNNLIRIGHPGGVIEAEMCAELKDNNVVIKRAAIGRTARIIMEGVVNIPPDVFE